MGAEKADFSSAQTLLPLLLLGSRSLQEHQRQVWNPHPLQYLGTQAWEGSHLALAWYVAMTTWSLPAPLQRPL